MSVNTIPPVQQSPGALLSGQQGQLSWPHWLSVSAHAGGIVPAVTADA